MTFLPRSGFEAELQHELEAAGAMRAPAEQIAAAARDIAPVETGAYRDSIHVESDESGTRVVAGTDHAIWVEWGTFKDPAQHVLTRAAESGGFSLGGGS